MSFSAIRTQIKAILESVSGIGLVHDYDRWAVDWAKILELLKPSNQDKVNGWMITRTALEERLETFGRNLAGHSILIRGVYSLDDAAASGKTFDDLIDAIRDAFRVKYDLNGSCQSTFLDFGSMQAEGKIGIQMKISEMRTFAGVLCHYCELLLGAQERISY